MDDARERRFNLFYSELTNDIPQLEKYYKQGDIGSIKNFAHKYKMRLAYFEFEKALEYCVAVDTISYENNKGEFVSSFEGLLFELNSIKKKKAK